jgi:hypothetical protein
MNQTKNPLHLDAAESSYFEAELKHVKAQTYDVIRKDLKAVQLIPVSSEANAGAEFIAYRSFDAVGVAKIVSDYSKDFPRVDSFGTEKQVKVKSLGDAYGYTIQEIRRSQMENKRLETRRAMAARRAIDELQDKIGWFGDAASGLKGLINADNISEYAPAAGLWTAKTPQAILKDVAGIITAAPLSTNGKEVPDTLIMPLSLYNILAYTPIGDNADKTILKFIRDNYPTITRIEWVNELAGAGAGGTNRIMAYTRDPMKLTLEIPQPFEQFPAQQKGLEYEVICHQRTAGVIVYFPQSVVFADGL